MILKRTYRQPVAIIGAGGFARETLDVFDALRSDGVRVEVLGFIVDPEYGSAGTVVNDLPILGGFDWVAEHARSVDFICGVGAPEVRRGLVQRAIERGATFASVTHPTVAMTRWVEVGRGSIITAACVLTNQIRIGDHVHLNLDCTVGHDVNIDDFVTVAPGVHISGKVQLGEGAYIGTGASVIEGRRIGGWSVVGAGAVVVGDVPENATVVGVPGRVIKTRPPGWQFA